MAHSNSHRSIPPVNFPPLSNQINTSGYIRTFSVAYYEHCNVIQTITSKGGNAIVYRNSFVYVQDWIHSILKCSTVCAKIWPTSLIGTTCLCPNGACTIDINIDLCIADHLLIKTSCCFLWPDCIDNFLLPSLSSECGEADERIAILYDVTGNPCSITMVTIVSTIILSPMC